MFEQHRHQEAVAAYQRQLAQWTEHRQAYAELVSLARHFAGTPSGQLLLQPGESLFFTVTGASLIEERRGPGHYEGRSQGISVPIGSIGGRSVRYRVGRSRGHFVQGQPHPSATDTGTAFITDRRVVFSGSARTRECAFSKLIAVSCRPGGHDHPVGVQPAEADDDRLWRCGGRPLRLPARSGPGPLQGDGRRAGRPVGGASWP